MDPATSLHKNPFHLLGASVRDSAQAIFDLADLKSDSLSEEVCRKARADLTTPRLRLAAEVRWLPGAAPRKAEALIAVLEHKPLEAAETMTLPPLAASNLMAAGLQVLARADRRCFERLSISDAAEFILQLAAAIDSIDPNAVLRDINEDRAVAGFAQLPGVGPVESELAAHRRQHLGVVRDALNRLPPKSLVETMTETVRRGTSNGQNKGSAFIAELVDVYQDETAPFLRAEKDRILAAVQEARDAAGKDDTGVSGAIWKIETLVTNWARIAEPIQVSRRARGLDNSLSEAVAYPVRSLGCDLHNDHGLFDQPRRIVSMLQSTFSFVPEIAVLVQKDADALQGIGEKRAQAAKAEADWAAKITFQTDVGVVFKERLAISPEGVEMKGRKYPLGSITRIRWGGVRHSINGIPTGTTYTVAVGDNRSEEEITIKASAKYEAFTERLWQAVGIRLMGDILATLRKGQTLTYGDAVFDDMGVTLIRRKIFGANESAHFPWVQLQLRTQDGSLFIHARNDSKYYSSMSYLHTPNAHLIDHLIRLKFKTAVGRMSDLLS